MTVVDFICFFSPEMQVQLVQILQQHQPLPLHSQELRLRLHCGQSDAIAQAQTRPAPAHPGVRSGAPPERGLAAVDQTQADSEFLLDEALSRRPGDGAHPSRWFRPAAPHQDHGLHPSSGRLDISECPHTNHLNDYNCSWLGWVAVGVCEHGLHWSVGRRTERLTEFARCISHFTTSTRYSNNEYWLRRWYSSTCSRSCSFGHGLRLIQLDFCVSLLGRNSHWVKLIWVLTQYTWLYHNNLSFAILGINVSMCCSFSMYF